MPQIARRPVYHHDKLPCSAASSQLAPFAHGEELVDVAGHKASVNQNELMSAYHKGADRSMNYTYL